MFKTSSAMSSNTQAAPNLYDNEQDFWKNYKEARPVLPTSFYQRFYDYHASRRGSFGTVQDVGAGYGEMSLELSKKFSHVILTDPAQQSLDVARDLIRTADSAHEDHFTFRQESIEDSNLPEASVDAIFSNTALHWTEPEKSIPVMTRQLKPGGTLFLSLCGFPRWRNPRIQEIWWDLLKQSLLRLVERDPSAEFIIKHSSAVGDTAYDCVALSESDFEPGIIRLKLNKLDNPDAFIFAPDIAGDIVYESKIGLNDRLEEGVEDEWFFESDIEGIRTKMASYPLNPDPEMLEEHMAKIEKILDGGKCEGRWPVSVVLATKRKKT